MTPTPLSSVWGGSGNSAGIMTAAGTRIPAGFVPPFMVHERSSSRISKLPNHFYRPTQQQIHHQQQLPKFAPHLGVSYPISPFRTNLNLWSSQTSSEIETERKRETEREAFVIPTSRRDRRRQQQQQQQEQQPASSSSSPFSAENDIGAVSATMPSTDPVERIITFIAKVYSTPIPGIHPQMAFGYPITLLIASLFVLTPTNAALLVFLFGIYAYYGRVVLFVDGVYDNEDDDTTTTNGKRLIPNNLKRNRLDDVNEEDEEDDNPNVDLIAFVAASITAGLLTPLQSTFHLPDSEWTSLVLGGSSLLFVAMVSIQNWMIHNNNNNNQSNKVQAKKQLQRQQLMHQMDMDMRRNNNNENYYGDYYENDDISGRRR